METSPIFFFKKKVRVQKYHREVDNCRKGSSYIKHFMLGNIGNNRYMTTCHRKGQATIGYPFPHQSTQIKQVTHPVSQIYTVHVSIKTNPDFIRGKHSAHPTVFGACSPTCN